MEKAEILAIVKEHMGDCVGISQRDIDDHGDRIATRIKWKLSTTERELEISALRAEIDAMCLAVRAVLINENSSFETATGRAMAYLQAINNAVGHRNIAECGRLTREYVKHNCAQDAPNGQGEALPIEKG